jgi:methyl-accepting chemotaxis protein
MLKRRSSSLADWEVQSFLVIRLCIHWVLFLTAIAIGVLIWIRLFSNPIVTWQETQTQFIATFLPVLITSIAILPVFIFDSVRLSNRFTGPIFRLRKALSNLSNGKQEVALEFRENDFWKSLATDFNAVVGLKEIASDSKSDPSCQIPK